MKILVIDDEPKLRTLLARIVQMEGFETLTAEDAKTAFKQLAQHEIAIVFCDVKLPDAHGVELTKKIKAQYPHIEVIVLTAYGNIPTKGNKAETARLLEIGIATLYRKIEEYHL